jgi:hypothetical protein
MLMSYPEGNILAQTLGFGMGTALSTLLLVMVSRSGGTDRKPRFWFAGCILVANCAGLVKNIALLTEPQFSVPLESKMRAIGFAAGALCPCSIIPIWRSAAIPDLKRRTSNWILLYSVVSGILLAALVIAGAWAPLQISSAVPEIHWLADQDAIGNLTIYNGLLTTLAAGLLLERCRGQPITLQLP